MAIIGGIVAAIVIVALAILIFFANGTRPRGESLGTEKQPRQPQVEKRRHRVAGID